MSYYSGGWWLDHEWIMWWLIVVFIGYKPTTDWEYYGDLIGGLEHEWNIYIYYIYMTFHSVGNIIIPTDFQSIIFQRGRNKPPTRWVTVDICSHNLAISQTTPKLRRFFLLLEVTFVVVLQVYKIWCMARWCLISQIGLQLDQKTGLCGEFSLKQAIYIYGIITNYCRLLQV